MVSTALMPAGSAIATPAQQVPFVELRANHASIAHELNATIQRILQSASFIGGPDHAAFQEEFADYCQADYAVGVASGTDALWLALKGLGVERGDEVITTPLTFIATAEAITLCGAKPVFCDIDPETWTLDADEFHSRVTLRTRVVVPVHLYGQPADMADIADVARLHAIKIVEDAAQAHGASYRGRSVGGIGDAAAFSFFPGKNLGALGDAGVVVTNDERLATFVRKYCNHGRCTKYEHDFAGTNSRLDGLQAAVLRVKLRHLERWNEHRRRAAGWYRERLEDCAGVRLPAELSDRTPVYHLFVVEVESRDDVLAALKEHGVQAGVHYPIPLHLQPAYRRLGYKRGSFPNAERAADRVLSLPMFPEITESQVDYVCEVLRNILGD